MVHGHLTRSPSSSAVYNPSGVRSGTGVEATVISGGPDGISEAMVHKGDGSNQEDRGRFSDTRFSDTPSDCCAFCTARRRRAGVRSTLRPPYSLRPWSLVMVCSAVYRVRAIAPPPQAFLRASNPNSQTGPIIGGQVTKARDLQSRGSAPAVNKGESNQCQGAGQKCTQSGIYQSDCACCSRIALSQDETFPPCGKCSRAVNWDAGSIDVGLLKSVNTRARFIMEAYRIGAVAEHQS